MSKHDDHFFNSFSAIILILVAITIALIALARSIGVPFEEARAASDSQVQAQVSARTAPVGRVAVAGQDNAALAIVMPPGEGSGTMVVAALPANGEETYHAVCGTCHTGGLAGAPKVGDRAAWGPRIAQGKATLYDHAIKGYQGKAGVMPAKGGRSDLPDDLVRAAVDHMLGL